MATTTGNGAICISDRVYKRILVCGIKGRGVVGGGRGVEQ